VDVPHSDSERFEEEKKLLALVGIITLECLARNVVPSPSITFGFRAVTAWYEVALKRIACSSVIRQHATRACRRSCRQSTAKRELHCDQTVRECLFYSLPCRMEVVGSVTIEHICASSLSKPTPLKFMKKGYLSISFAITVAVALHGKSKEHVVDVLRSPVRPTRTSSFGLHL
jgi:hypothetical protein